MSKHDEIRRLAEKATPGEWEPCEMSREHATHEGEVGVHVPKSGKQKPDGTWHALTVCRGMNGPNKDNNAAYLAAVSPDAVLALLDELDDLHYAQSMTGHAHLSGPIKYTQSLRDENRALRAGLEMARACIARGADTTAESVIDDALAAADKAGGR